jgi:hypothetical protein
MAIAWFATGSYAQPQPQTPVVVAPPGGGVVTTPVEPVRPPTEPAASTCPSARSLHVKAAAVAYWPGLYRDRIVVKLHDTVDLQLGKPTRSAAPKQFAGTGALAGSMKRDLGDLNRLLADASVRDVRTHFSVEPTRLRALHESAQARSCKGLAKLENYYWIDLAAGTHGEELATRLNQSPLVEVAFLPPIPRDADNPPATDSFQGSQGYLDAADVGGIDAKAAWKMSGGRGAGMSVIDVEANWNVNHEDLTSPFWFSGVPGLNEISDFINAGDINTNHGTAVVGIMIARNDGHGVTGIASDARWGGSSIISVNSLRGSFGGASGIHDASVADAIVRAIDQLHAGDAILIEQHSQGPSTGTSCTCNCSQFEFVPMEFFPDSFDAIASATAAGLVVVEAGGNGSMNLDRAEYEGRFDRTLRDSGAIMVGATDKASLTPACFTNRGTRIDVNAWGDGVTSTGYGDVKANGSDVNQFYTNTFSGTSSASPIVTGAVLAVQGVLKASGHGVLTPEQMRALLVQTGSFPASLIVRDPRLLPRIDPRLGLGGFTSNRSPIGPRPDLRRALAGFASATASAGGGGGDAYTLRCATGTALVGVRGRAGAYIDQIRGICAVADGGSTDTARAGGDGGTPFVLQCNDGRVVTGVRGRAGAFVDSLQLECSDPAALGAGRRTTDTAGGSGGSSYGPMRCSTGRFATGLRGGAGAVIDRLQLLCSEGAIDASIATPWVSNAVGGNGGDASTISCASNEVLAGVRVKAGYWLDSIEPRCVAVTATGAWSGSVNNGTRAGGSGGTVARLTCPDNQAVSAISGRAGAYIDQLRLRCSALTSATTVADDSDFLGSVGGTGGDEFDRIDCPSHLAATGFAVRSGAYVDQLKLICGH